QPNAGILTDPDSRGVREPEIYNPFDDTWTWLNDPAPSVRNYHSVGLLMPDGRVWVAGSDVNAGRGMTSRNLDIDLYETWYNGNPDRPEVAAAPSMTRPNETVLVQSTFAAEIERVVLIRCGSATHSFNPDQRYISVKYRYDGEDRLEVEMPPNNNILPPGP